MSKRYFLISAVVLALAVLISSGAIADLSAGTKAPTFSLPTLNGKTFNLEKKPGKVIVMDIWATWCGPCRAEIPYLVNLNKKYTDKDVQFVGVAIDQDKSAVQPFVKRNGINYTIALDPNARTVGGPYQVRGIPATYIIDKNGVIRFAHTGFSGEAQATQMDKEIQSLLKK